MDFNNDNNSIFSSPDFGSTPSFASGKDVPMPDYPQQENLLGNFLNSIKNKIDETKQQKKEEEFNEDLNKFIDTNSETFLILKSFGCKIIVHSLNEIEIFSEELLMRGTMHIKEDSVEMDEDCKRLFDIISQIISGGYRIEDILARYEQEEFYPIGKIEPVKIIYKGTEITASKGTLANPQGEYKTILFYKGYEIQPDPEPSKKKELKNENEN